MVGLAEGAPTSNGHSHHHHHGYEAYGIETQLLHAGTLKDRPRGAARTPIFQTTTYGWNGDQAEAPHMYVRPADSPNHQVLAEKLAVLEGTEAAVVAGSGMAAIAATLLSLLGPGDHLLTQPTLYWGTYALIFRELARLGVEVTPVDGAAPATWQAALRPTTRVIFLESITNPVVRVADVGAAAAFARRHGLVSVVDNTFGTPVLLRPAAEWGVDLVVHSATKYLNGHTDVVAGAVAGSAARIAQVTAKLSIYGGCLDPHACFLLERGLATLALRVRAQIINARAMAEFLEGHPQVLAVHWSGLPASPYHGLAQKYLGGSGGGVLAFELRGGDATRAAFLKALRLPLVAVSLGGVDTLIMRPAAHTGALLSPELEQEAGITRNLLRLALGIETTADLLADFGRALEAAAGAGPAAAAEAEAANAVPPKGATQ